MPPAPHQYYDDLENQSHLELSHSETFAQAGSGTINECKQVFMPIYFFCQQSLKRIILRHQPTLGLELISVRAPECFGSIHQPDRYSYLRTLRNDDTRHRLASLRGDRRAEGKNVSFNTFAVRLGQRRMQAKCLVHNSVEIG